MKNGEVFFEKYLDFYKNILYTVYSMCPIEEKIAFKIEHNNLSEKAYQIITEQIITGIISQGTHITDVSLSTSLGISRTPVREALNKLVKDGLIESIPRKGFYVNHLLFEDVSEIYELRELLETFALKRAINKIPEQDINILINLFNEAEENAKENDFKLEIQADRDLHGVIIKYAENKRLEKFHTMLSNQIHIFRLLEAQKPERAKESLEHHKKILNAIKERNENLAVELLKAHIDKVKNNILTDFSFGDIKFFGGVEDEIKK